MSDFIKILQVEEAERSVLCRHIQGDPQQSQKEAEANSEVFGDLLTPDEAVTRIIAEVRKEGDRAVRRYTEIYDGASLSDTLVPRDDISAARSGLAAELLRALKTSADRIRRFHERQDTASWIHRDEDGGVGQMVRPLERVGVYVPGGSAPLASSLLMAAIPARVAGVKEIIVATPPDSEGRVHPAVLAAADVAGVDAIYRMGGAQAIAALAYGTESVSRVDKIVGPGNRFVVLAKRQVYGVVDIDALSGPTETLVVADESADPVHVAVDLMAQAEHDPLASAILITTCRTLAERVVKEIGRRIEALERAEIIRASLAANGGIVLAHSIEQAIELANGYSPEHLCLLVADPWERIDLVENAGGVFVGEFSSEALGDYVTGPSHVMPTRATARFSSPLNLRDFTKIISVFGVNRHAHERLAPIAVQLAEAEGLTAHAAAIKARGLSLKPREDVHDE